MWHRLYDKKKQHGIKENKEKEGRGISGFPPLQEQTDYTTETKIKPLKKKREREKKLFLTSITQLGWFLNMVISITFRMGSRMSRWDLINSEILLICLPTRREKSVGLYKGISLYNLIKAALGIQLGAH